MWLGTAAFREGTLLRRGRFGAAVATLCGRESPAGAWIGGIACRVSFFFFQAEDGIRDHCVTGVQTCALPISRRLTSSTVTAKSLENSSASSNGTRRTCWRILTPSLDRADESCDTS